MNCEFCDPFDRSNPDHRALSKLGEPCGIISIPRGERCTKKVEALIARGLVGPIGRLRSQVKVHLQPELQESNRLTTHILGL